MQVRVRKYINAFGDMRWGIEIKRWWFPIWIRVQYWASKEAALHHAELWKAPDITEI